MQILIGTEPTELMESTTEIIRTTEFNKNIESTEIIRTTEFNKKIESTEIIHTTEKLQTIPETEKIKKTQIVENNELTEKIIITEEPTKITNKIYELTEFVENPENTIYNENKTFSNCSVEYTKLSQDKIECNNECKSYDKNKYEYKMDVMT